MKRLLGIALLALGAANFASAVPVTYQYTTGPASGAFNFVSANPELLSALNGLTVSGTFTYDNEVPQTGTTKGPIVFGQSDYAGAISNLTGAVGGFTLSQDAGGGSVANEGYSFLTSDFFQLGATTTTGFVLGDLGLQLVATRFFWIESTLIAGSPAPIPDFLGDNGLPTTLPAFPGRLALDFVSLTLPPGPLAFNFAFFDGLAVTAAPAAVSEPGTLPLLATAGLGLLLLGVPASRRRVHRERRH
jgi:hypothetical protein